MSDKTFERLLKTEREQIGQKSLLAALYSEFGAVAPSEYRFFVSERDRTREFVSLFVTCERVSDKLRKEVGFYADTSIRGVDAVEIGWWFIEPYDPDTDEPRTFEQLPDYRGWF